MFLYFMILKCMQRKIVCSTNFDNVNMPKRSKITSNARKND